jgi:hypothetical protein
MLCRLRLYINGQFPLCPDYTISLVQPLTSSACGGSPTGPPFVLQLTLKNRSPIPPTTPFSALQAAARRYKC